MGSAGPTQSEARMLAIIGADTSQQFEAKRLVEPSNEAERPKKRVSRPRLAKQVNVNPKGFGTLSESCPNESREVDKNANNPKTSFSQKHQSDSKGSHGTTASKAAGQQATKEEGRFAVPMPKTPEPKQSPVVDTVTNLRIINPDKLSDSADRGIPQVIPNTPGIGCFVGTKSELHASVVNHQVSQVQRLLKSSVYNINSPEENGYTPLMSAAALRDERNATRICRALLAHDANLELVDSSGFTAAHWAAAVGNVPVLKLFKEHGCNFSKKSMNGDTPMHRAARLGRLNCISFLVNVDKTLLFCVNKAGHVPLEVAGMFAYEEKDTQLEVQEKVRNYMFSKFECIRTLILHHDDCKEHITTDGHQEAPERIDAILEILRESFPKNCLEFSDNFEPATPLQLRLAHSAEYVNFVMDLHHQVKDIGVPVAFTPRVQRAVSKINDVKNELGCDTCFSNGSLPAAIRASGSVCHAVDMLLQRRCRNAFCVVRPPGHHAGVKGLLQNSNSCGFCIFNNVAIGAAHALSNYPDEIKRVAIIDFDVHHGNGTEEVVRMRINKPDCLLFFSVHLFDNEASDLYEFYPGTGEDDVLMDNVINAPVAPLWRKVRTSGRGRSNSSSLYGSTESDSATSVNMPSRKSSAADSKPGDEHKAQVQGNLSSGFYPGARHGRLAFRAKVMTKLLPSLRAFNPDLIMVSAGFDAGENDIGCSKTVKGQYSCGADLLPDDYQWMTEKIQDIAKVCCQGRIVSVLEGGYGSWKRTRGASGKVEVRLDRNNLARNALGHVKGLWGEAKHEK